MNISFDVRLVKTERMTFLAVAYMMAAWDDGSERRRSLRRLASTLTLDVGIAAPDV